MIEERRLRKEIGIPEGINVELGNQTIVKKGHFEIKKKLFYPTVDVKKEGGKIIITPKKFTKREKKIINTFRSHLLNMFKGVEEPYVYKMKICSSHFPMSVGIEGKTLVVKNYLGEKVPRKTQIPENVDVKIEGDNITITSPDREAAGLTATRFEQCTRITNRDRRVFQDGIWLVEKGRRQ
jgi:large subunit ribosomal protein L6